MSEQTYVGTELEIFAKAVRWKHYFHEMLAPYMGKCVLEVGAGLGANTAILCDGSQSEWLCLEPDPALLKLIQARIAKEELLPCCESRGGFVSDLGEREMFETILYLDVLEHIEDDSRELETARAHLTPGGHLIVLAPAHNFLYSPFDKTIGHYRRYADKSISALTPSNCRIVERVQLDALGVFTSLANRILLRQPIPTEQQILFWDRKLVPISRFLDRLVNYRFGRSILCIWECL